MGSLQTACLVRVSHPHDEQQIMRLLALPALNQLYRRTSAPGIGKYFALKSGVSPNGLVPDLIRRSQSLRERSGFMTSKMRLSETFSTRCPFKSNAKASGSRLNLAESPHARSATGKPSGEPSSGAGLPDCSASAGARCGGCLWRGRGPLRLTWIATEEGGKSSLSHRE